MDKHLNLFRFFNGSSYEFWEDNLSRAFAICLKNDATFLSFILKNILEEKIYSQAFSNEYPNSFIDIDLQQKVNYLSSYTYIYAVACSGLEINEKEIQKVKSRTTDNPETDLLIKIGDICIIFEFKRTNEDCSAQLKQQAEIIKNNSPDSEPIKFIDLDWMKIIKIALSVLSIERQINNENVFLKNFIDFVEDFNPDWFPEKKLSEIPFPIQRNNYEDPNESYLYNRLNTIKEYVFGADNTKWVADRYIISIDKQWAQELHVGYSSINGENFITVEIYPGDTKGQGYGYFKKDKNYNWEEETICNYSIVAYYYLKFSHFNSGITWLELTKEESKKTHNFDFFKDWSGRYNAKTYTRNWKSKFVKDLNKIIPGWKDRTDWDEVIANSNRTYFDLSVGTHLMILVPYTEAKKLDDIDGKNNKLAEKIRKIYKELSKKIDT